MCPEEKPRSFPTHRTVDTAQQERALAVAERYLRFPDDEHRRLFKVCVLGFDVGNANRPYRAAMKRKTLKRVKLGIAELINALLELDFVTQGKLQACAGRVSEGARESLSKSNSGLATYFLDQELSNIQPAWNEAIEMCIAELPSRPSQGRSKETIRNRLVRDLQAFFVAFAKPHRSVKRVEQEKRFVDAVLATVGEGPVNSVAELVRNLPKVNLSKPLAEKR